MLVFPLAFFQRTQPAIAPPPTSTPPPSSTSAGGVDELEFALFGQTYFELLNIDFMAADKLIGYYVASVDSFEKLTFDSYSIDDETIGEI